MFVGHYSVSYAVKAVDRGIPLWALFVAVQLVDIAWAVLVLLGIERVRIVPGITATNPLDLYYMPYTHSLVASALWAVAAAVVYRVWRARRPGLRTPTLIGLAVFSHWVLDWVVHRPDLPLYDNVMKVGLGLWNHPVLALTLEVGLLVLGMVFYLRVTEPVDAIGRYGMPAFVALMAVVQVVTFFGAPPPSDTATAVTALVAYALFAAIAYLLERRRQMPVPRTADRGGQ